MTGLRELKKQQTRQVIADTAARLFAERGFDAVTVDEIAQAANVARKTVFNYFPTKEDLVLHHIGEHESRLLRVARERPAGMPLVTAFRQQAVEVIRDRRQRAGGLGPARLAALVHGNVALQRAAHAKHVHLIGCLAAEIAADTGGSDLDPVAVTVANSVLGACRALARAHDRRLTDGASPAVALAALRADAERVFDLLERGLAGYAPANPASASASAS